MIIVKAASEKMFIHKFSGRKLRLVFRWWQKKVAGAIMTVGRIISLNLDFVSQFNR